MRAVAHAVQRLHRLGELGAAGRTGPGHRHEPELGDMNDVHRALTHLEQRLVADRDSGHATMAATGVDNAEKLEFMRSLGANHVIDYTREDFTTSGRAYDVIADLAARSAFAYRGSLAPGGRYLYVGGSVGTLLQVLLLGPVLGRARARKYGFWPSGSAQGTWRLS